MDDELKGLTYLKMLCQQLPDLEVVKVFNSPIKFINEVPKLDFDFCILDIEMPEMNGLQVANLLKGKPLIFATAYKEYAVEAFDLNAVDYIRKPIKIDRLKQAIDKVKIHITSLKSQSNHNFIQLNTNKGKAILFFDKIAYIKTSEIDSRDKILYLFSGDEYVLKNITFDKLSKLLPTSYFGRINKKELISLLAVDVFSYDEITTNLTDTKGKKIILTLSESYRIAFMNKMSN